MRSASSVCVEVGAGHVACGVFSPGTSGGLVLEDFAVERHGADPREEGEWFGRTAEALAVVANRVGRSDPVALVIPGHLALTQFIRTPSVAPAQRAKIIPFEAAQAIPYPLGEVGWHHRVLADDGQELELRFTAVKLAVMERLCAAAGAAGLVVQQAVTSGDALQAAFRRNYAGVSEPVLVADLGAHSTALLLVERERCQMRTLALAGNALTQALADEFGLEVAAAESIKVRALGVAPAGRPAARPAAQRLTDRHLAQLQGEIRRFTASCQRQAGAPAPTALYVTGGGSLLAGLPEALAEQLAVRVERFDPLRRVEVSAGAATSGAADSAPLLANLVGLAGWPERDQAEGVALLPPARRQQLVFRRRQPWWIAAAVLLVLALIPPAWQGRRLARETEAKAVALEARLRPWRATVLRNADNLAKLQQVQAQIAALQGVAEAKSRWVGLLADLQDQLGEVEDVWLDRLQLVRLPPPGPGLRAGSPPEAPGLELVLSGRLLDADNPGSKVSAESEERVRQLLAGFTRSPFIAAVKDERFDNSQPGLLRFDCTLVIKSAAAVASR